MAWRFPKIERLRKNTRLDLNKIPTNIVQQGHLELEIGKCENEHSAVKNTEQMSPMADFHSFVASLSSESDFFLLEVLNPGKRRKRRAT